ncbi:Bro-N domain-containing protein [Comamonas aquatica]|uniref:Bro-N domain-containing protein n=1 Tax=Comamonas aquatica TaxID=225991 RepID=A0AA42W066_9BURK|nr:Bro-N domain-containing protein [Comamonas aquatica]MDH1429130.1 Bro-N domain-containing protein [Comamonas aquatica]MDH1605007.1 Bro-N domain-containing protein [Comamonas aquatica]MDH1616031.1 Bro-N domain-containing protein [Comamonas aquatica]MDH2004896.1 Bro-N domain-containing protein [Comamonas aquatica]
MADITPFNFGAHAVRVITRNNQPWFVASDVCNALGYINSRDAVAKHLDDDEKGVANSDTLGGKQQLTIISESGLYALVLRSRKPEARKFAKWVTSEVLPSIRQTGGYQAEPLAQRTARAHQIASAATAQVFEAVFNAAMRGDFNPSLDRVLVNCNPVDGKAQAITLERDAIVTTTPHLIRAVASDMLISTADLTMLALACTQRLASRTPIATQGRLQI